MSKTTRGGARTGAGRKKGKPNKKTVVKQRGEAKGLAKAIDRYAITKERVLHGLAQLAFSDIRNVGKWGRKTITRKVGGKIKKTVVNYVDLFDSDDLDDDAAASIKELKLSNSGAASVKFYDKRAALVDLYEHLGLRVHKHEHSGPDGKPIAHEHEIKDMTSAELARRFEEIVAAAAKAPAPAKD